MRILCVIPARGGSKGIPGKNTKLLDGKPLLQYTSEIALAAEVFADIIVSTDDTSTAELARNLNLNVPFLRPSELAQDDTPTISVLAHALRWFQKAGLTFDAVCLLQVTSPFRTVDFVRNAVAKFCASGADSLISVQKVPHQYNPHWVFEEDADGNLKIATGESDIIPRRQQLPTAYHRDGSIYLTRTAVLLGQNSLYGSKISYIESPAELYSNIDTPADWEMAESIARRLRS